MGSLEKLLQDKLKKVPRILFAKLLRSKLSEMGAPDNEEFVEALISHLESGSEDKFLWDDGDENEDYSLSLDITEEDLAKLEDDFSNFMENDLKDIIVQSTEDAAQVVLQSLKEKWPKVDEYEKGAFFEFGDNLEKRWGGAFSSLRMLLAICREAGEEATVKSNQSGSKKDRTLRLVLLKLHARASQIGGEIVKLLGHGFADGAMARWRTLHELVVVASTLIDGGDDLARRYMDHEIIETKAELDEYQRCYQKLGLQPIEYRERKRIEREYERILGKYGKEFRTPYGWAASHLDHPRPLVNDLARAVSYSHMYPYYKLASQNVHASSKRLFNSLSAMDGYDMMMHAGPSNAGIDEPAINTAHSLVQITSLLNNDQISKLDFQIELKTLLLLRDETSKKFMKAAQELQHDHMAILENL